MSTLQEIALEVLPHLRRSVIDRQPHTYGWYAHKIGRDPAKEGIVIGQAMHAIGAVCVIAELPVLPLHYATTQSFSPRGVFESDPLECGIVLPHIELLLVTAREYPCSSEELESLERRFKKGWVDSNNGVSPHQLWRKILTKRVPDDVRTYFERALSRYRTILDALKGRRPSL
jgi:hypothetical protein